MADVRERYSDPEEALRTFIEGMLSGLWVGGPGIIEDFNAVLQTASVQPAIQGRRVDKDGNIIFSNMPLCVDVPVFFFGAGGYTITAPVKKGDECFIAFADRCIDSWWQNGAMRGSNISPQPPAEYRMHDLSDGFAFIGFRSNPRALANVSTDSLQIRTDDGEAFVEMANGHVVNITAPGGVNINTPVVSISGVIDVLNTGGSSYAGSINGTLKVIDGDMIADTISLKNHVHTGVQTGGGETGGPVG